jgi:hypothetical protein
MHVLETSSGCFGKLPGGGDELDPYAELGPDPPGHVGDIALGVLPGLADVVLGTEAERQCCTRRRGGHYVDRQQLLAAAATVTARDHQGAFIDVRTRRLR